MNITQWQYCPHCGKKGARREKNAFECHSCHRCIYENVAASTVMVFYTGDGRIVMSERAHPPEEGKYDFPGGFADPRETAGEVMIRELHEELGVILKRSEITLWMTAPNVYQTSDGLITNVMDIVFTKEVAEEFVNSMRPADDVAAVHLVNPCDVSCDIIAFESVHTVIRTFCMERMWEK